MIHDGYALFEIAWQSTCIGEKQMKKSVYILLSGFPLLSSPLYAGVAMDMVTKDATGQETERTRIHAQSGMLRVDGTGNQSNVSMIFLGDSFLVLNHDDKNYVVMDEAMLNEVTSQIDAAMKQMEAQLANMPPEQRAMAEQMMKGQMPGMTGQQSAAPPPPTVEKIGASEWRSRPCMKYAVHEGGEKTQDVCAASLDDIEGADEMMQAFLGMAEFVKRMTESLPGAMTANISQNPGAIIDQVDGFPVHSVQYEFGTVSGEMSVESISEQALDDGLFAAPEDYQRQDPFQGR